MGVRVCGVARGDECAEVVSNGLDAPRDGIALSRGDRWELISNILARAERS